MEDLHEARPRSFSSQLTHYERQWGVQCVSKTCGGLRKKVAEDDASTCRFTPLLLLLTRLAGLPGTLQEVIQSRDVGFGYFEIFNFLRVCQVLRVLWSPGGSLQEVAQSRDVALGHLEGLKLAEFVVGADGRDDFSQPVERFVEAVHPTSFPGVGGESSSSEYRRAGSSHRVTSSPLNHRVPHLSVDLCRAPGFRPCTK